MQGSRWWLICYDVRDAKRLRKAAKLMEGYGERMQYSVFRCWLHPRGMEQLRWQMTQLLTQEDDILFIPLCSDCVRGMRSTIAASEAPLWPREPEGHKIV